MRFSVRHIEANGIGYSDGYTTLEAFFAPNPASLPVLPFLDLRGHIFDDGKLAANIGIGFRGISTCRVMGLNFYYDFRNTTKQDYNQIGIGFEMLTPRWEARVNGYLPLGTISSAPYDFETSSYIFNSFNQHSVVIQQTITNKVQFAMKGVDAEFGYHFLQNKTFDVYLGLGPYYYNYKSRNVFGGEARLAIKLSRFLTLEGSASYDNSFREIAQGQISINIPFGPKAFANNASSYCNATLLTQRAIQDVARQEIIVVDKKKKTTEYTYPALDPGTGLPYYFIFVDNTSHSQGTFESPYPTLAEAELVSRPGDIIYLFPGDGTSSGVGSGITLQDNQHLWGSGATHHLTTTEGIVLVPASSKDEVIPEISNANGDAITLANNNEISGIAIRSDEGYGISGVGTIDLTVSNNLFYGDQEAIHLINPRGKIEIKENQLESGIQIDATGIENATYLVKDNYCKKTPYFLTATYTDCSNVDTHISNNFCNTQKEPKRLTFNNTTTPKIPSQLTINDNKSYSDSNATAAALELTLQNHANLTVATKDNVFFSPHSKGVTVNMSENSKLDLALDNNTLHSITGATIALSHRATLRSVISNNHLMFTDGVGLKIALVDEATLLNLTIEGNIIQGSLRNGPGIQIESQNSSTVLGKISNNDLRITGDGIHLLAKDNSEQCLSIHDNTLLQLKDHGFNFTTTNSSRGDWDVVNNTFIATAPGAVVITSRENSTTRLHFNGNFAIGTDIFQLTNAGGTFYLAPPLKNTGAILQSGEITEDVIDEN